MSLLATLHCISVILAGDRLGMRVRSALLELARELALTERVN